MSFRKSTAEIETGDGKKRVTAWKHHGKILAVTNYISLWNQADPLRYVITHLPTGRQVTGAVFDDLKAAQEACETAYNNNPSAWDKSKDDWKSQIREMRKATKHLRTPTSRPGCAAIGDGNG